MASRSSKAMGIGRAMACGAVAIAIAWGAAACTAPIAPASTGNASASTVTPPPSAAAQPQHVTVPATAPAPVVERRIVGAPDLGIAEQLYEINTTVALEHAAHHVQGAWRDDEVPHAQIILQGAVPPELWTLLQNAPLQIEVVIPQGPTLDESGAALGAMADLIRASDPGMSFAGHYDTISGVYSFDYSAARALDPARFAEVAGGAALDIHYAGTTPVAGPQATSGDTPPPAP